MLQGDRLTQTLTAAENQTKHDAILLFVQALTTLWSDIFVFRFPTLAKKKQLNYIRKPYLPYHQLI